MRLGLCLLAVLLLSTFARAETGGVTVTLTGGEVVGHTRGLGTATVKARVDNQSGRTVEGLRLASWYSASDVLPPADADWRIHEFVFDPPLASGAAGNLQFSDDNAAQYVQLEARQVKYRAALRFGGVNTDLQFAPLRQNGSVFIALRDLVEAAGGRISSAGGYAVIERDGMTLRLKPGSAQAQVGTNTVTLGSAIVDQSGRSYIALKDAAALLGLTASDLGDDLYELK